MKRKREGGRKGRRRGGGMAIRSYHTEEFHAYKHQNHPSSVPTLETNVIMY